MKKTIALLLTVALLLTGLAACSRGSQPTASAPTGTSTPVAVASSAASTTPTDSGKPVTLNIMVGLQMGAELSDKLTPVAELEKKTNTILNFNNVPYEDMTQKIQTTIASGDLPDMMEVTDYDMASQYASAGTFIQLDDLIQKYGQNIQKIWTKYPDLQKDMKFDNGHFYAIPRVTERVFYMNNTINNTWLTECGLQMPQTLDDLLNVLTAFKAKYGANGGIPFGCGPWSGAWQAIVNPIMYAYDTNSQFFMFTPGKYEYGPYDRKDQFKAALVFLNKMYKDGLLDPQMFTTNDDQIMKQVNANQIGVFCSWADGYTIYGKGGSSPNLDYVPCPPFSGPDGKKHDLGAFPMSKAYYITKGCKNPEAAMKLCDYMFSDDGITLYNWGVEGDTYKVVDGKKAYTDKVMKSTVDPASNRFVVGLTYNFPGYADAESEYTVDSPLTKKQVEDYLTGNLFPTQPILTGTVDETTKFNKIMGDVGKYVTDSTMKFVTGQLDPETGFDAFIAQLEKMGIKDAIAIKTAQFDRWSKR